MIRTSKFKVGDRIRFIGDISQRLINKTGIIIESRSSNREFPYYVQFDDGQIFPVYTSEIKKIPIKGAQLLFDFAKE